MQPLTDLALENWHDFAISTRREILALLRTIGEKKQLIRMLIDGESDVCITTIIGVDSLANTLILDRSIDPQQNRRILAAGRMTFETTLDKIRIMFVCDGATETTFASTMALQIGVPATLIRLQRREYYRMATPVSNPVRAVIPLPDELGGGTATLPLSDISFGGIAVFDTMFVLDNTVGTNYPLCRLDLPDIGMVSATLQIRNSLDMTLLNNKRNRRLGCHFADISRANLAMVQRYITRLERERNARIAGLG